MVLIPYNTDAPLYHPPYVTVGLIVVNALVFVASVQARTEEVVPWILQFGDGLHPLQWVSSNFLHAGIMHLVGNMFFLWGFGLVVEGKVGWWRFLVIYLAIGAVESAIEQTVMLGSHGGALGASGAIYGLMAIALIWAPKNEMSCMLFFAIRPVMFEAPITVLATTFLVWQAIAAYLTKFSMSSAILHLTGAAVGAAIGVAMLKLEWVDCEGWDIYSVWKGKEGSRAKRPAEKLKPVLPPPSRPQPIGDEHTQFLTTALRNRLQAGDTAGAAEFYQKQRELHPEWKLTAADLMALIQALHKQRLWSKSVGPLTDYVKQYPADAARVRLKLAQMLIETEQRPARALKVLSKVTPADLPPELRAAHKKLMDRAAESQGGSELEFADDDDG